MRVQVTLEHREIQEAIREWLKQRGVVADRIDFLNVSGGLVSELRATTGGPAEQIIPKQGPYR
jgi:hypothetical protein